MWQNATVTGKLLCGVWNFISIILAGVNYQLVNGVRKIIFSYV